MRCAGGVRSLRKTNKMKSQDSKSLWATQTEKPIHYTYLKEFRVEQCTLFLQHKCTQHRPYTCFHWHFLNQRRRRPIRRRDGTFNYSPDAYCNKFDENTGICPDGDECPYLHRTAGDTERRYHLRYYKTGMCVHDTDTRGMCVKNGPHCAFAHGVEDVRPPVYDIRELQVLEMMDHDGINGSGPNNLDKERNMVNDDPKWQDTSYVLANYKTEQCKRPPRLCRQGYACPQYHNSRDRRRSPKKCKYRSTACPNVKHGDEWGEPSNCDNGDSCQYCHTRTEQQFHPEIYKSTKCNDIQQNGYCPRGAFCAFAHQDQEMTQVRETAASENCTGTSLADILQSALPSDNHIAPSCSSASAPHCSSSQSKTSSISSISNNIDSVFGNGMSHPPPPLAPIGSKPRHFSGNTLLGGSSDHLSLSGSLGASMSLNVGGISSYHKAPGSEREDRETNFKKQLAAIDNDHTLDLQEKSKRRQNLFLSNMIPSHPPPVSLPITLPVSMPVTQTSSFVSSLPSSLSSTVSPLAPPFYPTSDTVESVVGSALEELNLDEPLNIAASLDRELEVENNSFSNSISTGLASSGLLGSSAPVNIPGSSFQERSGGLISNPSPSSTSSPAFPHSFLQSSLHRENSLDQGAAAFIGTNGVGKISGSGVFSSTSGPSGGFFDLGSNMSPHSRNPLSNHLSQSPLMSAYANNSGTSTTEIHRLREELATNRVKLASWEEGIAQARTACEAWRREADEANRKYKIAEQTKEEVCFLQYVGKIAAQQKEMEELRSGRLGPYIQALHPHTDLEKLPLHTLKALQSQLQQDLESIEKVINNYGTKSEQWPGSTPTW
ncbi:RING finger protein unkempt homolog isoform X2 [Homarus americanus]|uniref:RING finger protein unkempt homolog isoform X2 n=1 Tax=Homarus americanus TaxID=6706 RepID=UPI001C481B3D|nr:RING finger protein unkempt homolog isoform X2 [Homarus americanus]